MKITFNQLNITNFKNHEELVILFGDITTISGKNGEGKSSIGEAVTWLLNGTDPFGVKIDPKPISDAAAETKVELLLQVDDKSILLSKVQKKAAKFTINEVPKKAKEFEAFINELFDKQLFLSLFNPAFFSSQHWQTQREQLLSYVGEPLNAEVFEQLPKIQSDLLSELLKKNNLEDLNKIHVERRKTHEKAYERASERVITMKEQYEKQKEHVGNIDTKSIEAEMKKLQTEREEIGNKLKAAQDTERKYNNVKNKIESLKQQIVRQKEIVLKVRDTKIIDTCNSCGQGLQDEALEKAKQNKIARFEYEKNLGSGLVKELKELEAAIKEMSVGEVDLSVVSDIDKQLYELQGQLRAAQQLELMQKEIDAAAENQAKVRKEKNESISIIEAVKDFKTKRSELMVSKLKSLFTTLDIKLYEELKNGEERATFEVSVNGKGYSVLSTAEKIKAGLEVVDVLSKESDLIAPCFVDNAESIINFTKPAGQLIIAKVADVELNIKAEFVDQEENING